MSARAPLRDQIRRMLGEESLDESRITRLERMLEPALVAKQWPRRRVFVAGLGAAAAALALLLALPVLLPELVPHRGGDVAAKIAREVFTNHTRIKSFDLETSSLAEVRSHFDRLDFVPVESALLDRSLTLRGARYCTLQGQLATQMVFETPEGEHVTLYQTVFDPARFGPIPDGAASETPTVVDERGLVVRIWREGAILMASGTYPER